MKKPIFRPPGKILGGHESRNVIVFLIAVVILTLLTKLLT